MLGEIISRATHSILRVFKHVGHTASVLLEASQQLSQADRQQPGSEHVKGHSGELHGSVRTQRVGHHGSFMSRLWRFIPRCVPSDSTQVVSSLSPAAGASSQQEPLTLQTPLIGRAVGQWEEGPLGNGPIGEQEWIDTSCN